VSRSYGEAPDSIFRLDLSGAPAAPYEVGPLESTYVPMRDGVRIALDVVRPMGDSATTQRDTVLVMTRYWRGVKGIPTNPDADLLVPHGYAVVIGDVRGTGASFGTWPYHRTRAETLDFSEILDWIVAQPWSTGRVVGYGLSYTANTADWMAERNHPALKGIVARFADYDPYEDYYFPGGVFNVIFGRAWSKLVKDLDRNINPDDLPGVRPVGPSGDAELAAALRDREQVSAVWDAFQEVTFRDDRPTAWAGASMRDWSIQEVANRLDSAGIAIQNWASWFDGGTAQGAIRRFLGLSNPMNVIIGPWNHGGERPYDPLRDPGEEIGPSISTQHANDIRFANACFDGEARRERRKVLHYYTLGEGAWKSTSSWPPPAAKRRWYMASDFRLRSTCDEAGSDSLLVDPAAADVTSNRWATAAAAGAVDYGDRREFDAARLVYTSEPLSCDVEITGHPVVHLSITSTREDGHFFVYLEAQDLNGVAHYLTEGQLRALHRKVWTDSPFSVLGPQHSYLERDAEPLVAGDPASLAVTLHPISARLPAGYRLRVCLAGSENATFANAPEKGVPPFLEFHRGPAGCYIDLPVIER
jgi:uncharacterized protein